MKTYRALGVLVVLVGGCEDPPPPPGNGAFILAVRTVAPAPGAELSGGRHETLEGMTGIHARVVKVQAVFRTVADDASTESLITLDSATHDLELAGDLRDQSTRQLAFFNVQPGFIMQLRAVTVSASIDLRGETDPVELPSAAQSGLKVDPIDGVPFEIKANERTGARIVLDPFKQLLRNQGQGFILKPEMKAEHISIDELSPIILDRADVRFNDGVPRATVDTINAIIGATVIDYDRATNYFIVHLPTSISLEDALQFYHGRGEVQFVLPDNILYDRLTPCDPQFQSPGPFTDVNAIQAWNTNQGSTRAILADVDSGFDLVNPDMVANYFINQQELRIPFFDADGDGATTDAEIASFDQDGDNLIGFTDLNSPGLQCLCTGVHPLPATCSFPCAGASSSCDFDCDGLVTPLDLVDGNCPAGICVANGRFQDGADNDGNQRRDDLVGWNFNNDTNLPANTGGGGCLGSHGVGTAGIIAAAGATLSGGTCPSTLVAGVNWSARLVPIERDQRPANTYTSSRGKAYLAFRYAVSVNADAINASFGLTLARNADPGCNLSASGLGGKIDSIRTALTQESTSLALGNTLLMAALDNCAQNDDSNNLIDWPGAINNPNIIGVAGTVTNSAPTTFDTAGSAFGPNTADIAAPDNNFTLLNDTAAGGGVNTGCGGNSFATPLVTGTVGLMIAADGTLRGNASRIVTRLLCNATPVPGMTAFVNNGRFLNMQAAVLNSGGCGP